MYLSVHTCSVNSTKYLSCLTNLGGVNALWFIKNEDCNDNYNKQWLKKCEKFNILSYKNINSNKVNFKEIALYEKICSL